MEEINLSWSNQMKNDVGGKLISLEGRREKVWTVIVFNHFSKELMGFLSNDATVENLQFTQRKEELEIFNDKKQNYMRINKKAINADKQAFIAFLGFVYWYF